MDFLCNQSHNSDSITNVIDSITSEIVLKSITNLSCDELRLGTRKRVVKRKY